MLHEFAIKSPCVHDGMQPTLHVIAIEAQAAVVGILLEL